MKIAQTGLLSFLRYVGRGQSISGFVEIGISRLVLTRTVGDKGVHSGDNGHRTLAELQGLYRKYSINTTHFYYPDPYAL
jgi:hypothetical protein